ncbi:MAG: hypothetical protein NTW10_00040 [Bacteroidetes bacterium]|nr:hypothetical protein [Bacteroidota bacterium]
MGKHLADNFRKDREAILQMVKLLIEGWSLDESSIQPENFEVIVFQLTSQFTFWVITLEIYDTGKSYEEMKQVYLKGIFTCFTTYLTKKGKAELEEVLSHPRNDSHK